MITNTYSIDIPGCYIFDLYLIKYKMVIEFKATQQ